MIYLIIYFIGYIFTYLMGRFMSYIFKETWTLEDRIIFLFFSLLSWVGFLIIIADRIGQKLLEMKWDKNKPVKW